MLTVRDVMTAEVLTFDPDVSVREAAEALAMERLGGAPVMRHGRLIGMVSASDLLDFMSALPAEPAEVRERSERGILDDHTVEEAMSRAPMRTVSPETPVRHAAELLSRERLHRLPVVDGERLTGIVSTSDIVRALARGEVERRVLVFPTRGRTD